MYRKLFYIDSHNAYHSLGSLYLSDIVFKFHYLQKRAWSKSRIYKLKHKYDITLARGQAITRSQGPNLKCILNK